MNDTRTPAEQGAAATYEKAIGGIPDSFDCLTGQQIREISNEIDRTTRGTYPLAEAKRIIRGHFTMLSTWHDALDVLDSELRAEVVEGPLSDWAREYLKAEARELFDATQMLLRAVAEYHHGVSGPRLDPDYGHAYALSNSALNPFK